MPDPSPSSDPNSGTAPRDEPRAESGSSRPPRGLFRMLGAIGPGIVVTGSVIGSGELINTPVQAARFGFVLLWVVILSCVVKAFLQIEFGRHSLVHNRTPFEAINSLPGWKWRGTSWIGPLFVLGSVLTAASLAGIMRATAGLLHSVWPLGSTVSGSTDVWSVIVFLATFVVLWRGTYQRIETVITVLVGIFSLSVVVGLALIQGTPYRVTSEQLLSGLTFSLGTNDIKLAAIAVVSLMGALGATGNELFMYPYWILEKGYGRHVGPSGNDGEWLSRARGWIRVLQLDVFVCTALATLTTLGYFLIGAAVFYGQGDSIGGDDIIDRLSAMYTQTYGSWSKEMFLLGAFCTLFSTLIVGTAAFARMWCDMFASFGWLRRDDADAHCRWIRIVQSIYLLGFLATGLFGGNSPEKMVIFGQYISGLFGTPVLMVVICWLAFRTDARVRMGWFTAVLLVLSVVIVIACVVGSVAIQWMEP